MTLKILLFFLAIGSGPALQLLGEPTVADFRWLAGHWSGTGLGGTCDETWAPPQGGAMTGTFRFFREGKPVFYEMLLITVEDGHIVMKVKHFNPDFEAWEEKSDSVTFKLEEASARNARFGGLALALESDGRLTIRLNMKKSDGSRTVETFNMRRTALPR